MCVQEQRRQFAWYLWHKYAIPRALGRFVGRSGLITKHWRTDPAIQAAFQAKSAMGFYDTWVSRCGFAHLFLSKAHAVQCAELSISPVLCTPNMFQQS